LENISVGSSFKTIGAEGTISCSLLLKNSKNKEDCFAGLDLNGVASLMVSDEKVV